MKIAEEYFNERKRSAVDIREHLDTLRRYAEQAKSIVECGVRTIVTTWPFI
jgi:hypothetical protein